MSGANLETVLPRPLCSMYYVYVLKNKDSNELYIGFSSDLKRRFKQHTQNKNFEIVYYESYKYEKDAREREIKLKHYGSAWRALKKRISA